MLGVCQNIGAIKMGNDAAMDDVFHDFTRDRGEADTSIFSAFALSFLPDLKTGATRACLQSLGI